MAQDATNIAIQAAKIAINPSGYLIGQIVEAASKTIAKLNDAGNSGIAELKAEAERQELEMRIAAAQARVAQEVAIAKRIETAEEVEMEEFYDYRGEGQLGLKTSGEDLSIGASGSGQRVSKRVYKFRGSTVSTNEVPSPKA